MLYICDCFLESFESCCHFYVKLCIASVRLKCALSLKLLFWNRSRSPLEYQRSSLSRSRSKSRSKSRSRSRSKSRSRSRSPAQRRSVEKSPPAAGFLWVQLVLERKRAFLETLFSGIHFRGGSRPWVSQGLQESVFLGGTYVTIWMSRDPVFWILFLGTLFQWRGTWG